MYDHDMVWAFVGMNGWRLYKLTDQLGLSYLWYNKDLRIIEIWGSYSALQKNPAKKINQQLDTFVEKVYFSSQGGNKDQQDTDADTDASSNHSETSGTHSPPTPPNYLTRTCSKIIV
jgi:hypothetical protein